MAISIHHLITSLEGGGTENFLYQVIAHSPGGYRHKVLFMKKDGVIAERLRARRIPVERTASPSAVRVALLRDKPNVLHTCLYRAHQVGRWVGRRAGIPVILSSQRSIDAWQKPWHRALDRWTLPMCGAVLANSSAAELLVKERRGHRTTPAIVRIDNAVETDQLLRQDRWTSRNAYQIPMDAVVGGALMRLHPEKGADRIPAFAEALLKTRQDLHFVIAGTGPLEKKLRAQTAGRPWSDRLHWLGWEDKTSSLFSILDFVWSLSREESFPQALLEASAMGIPWIAPDVGGTKDLLAAGASGLLYDPVPPRGAEHSGFELLRLLNEYKRKAEAAAPTLRGRFSIARMIQTFYQTVSHFQQDMRYNDASKNKDVKK